MKKKQYNSGKTCLAAYAGGAWCSKRLTACKPLLKISACLAVLFALAAGPGCPVFAQASQTGGAEKELIYVSGCPDLAPIEYYDSGENTYLGYIPQLFQLFSENSNYNIEYLSPGSSDERRQKLENLQVELISGCTAADSFSKEQWSNSVTVFSAETDGETVEYRVLFTDIASDEFIADFKNFVNSVTGAQSAGMLLQAAAAQNAGIPKAYFAVLSVICGVLLLCLACAIAAGVKRKKQMKMSKGTDLITGVGNYLYMQNYFRQFINDKNRSLYSAVYFLADSGVFAESNDESLNIYLRSIALQLNGNIADTDILARVDDSGFCVMKSSFSAMSADAWAQEMLRRIDIGQKENEILKKGAVYAGIYPLGAHDRDLDEIILKANRAALYAKKNNLRIAAATQNNIESGGEDDLLRRRLDFAFENNEFTIYLQFFIDAVTEKIVGAEALSRWNHPQKGVLLPHKFINLCEEESKIDRIDFNSLKKTCEYLESIHKNNDSDFFISCNFSRHTIVLPDFAKRFNAVLDEFTFPKSCLILEITEYSEIENIDIMYENIKTVQQRGIGVIMDDFGNGHLDLQDLGKYKFDGIKIDKSFIAGSHTQADDIILNNIITTASELDMVVIAEGVETAAQLSRLTDMGCVLMQGNYFYCPMPLPEAKRVYFGFQ
ncbi:MAG: EAL domain-containing protein [Clostridiales bacterium]|nr:EAL domain-containing protein [Clostridiales bacterium]